MICCILLTFKKNLSGTLLECQTVWIQISTDILYICSSFFCLLTVFKINFFKKKMFRNTIRVSNSLDHDQDRRSVFVRLLTVFKHIFFKKFFQEHCQSAKWFGSRSGSTFFLQTVCKCYQQTRPLARKRNKVRVFY